ncbi:MAG: sodium:proton antiporter [candidate division Zixibacteria bacterium]|nr:sodium:proton antiporter [candidate division Zixibacteria bacterium]MDD5426891.1 sodium:proton antiporter [candidate division Zixibacteria bacterium]
MKKVLLFSILLVIGLVFSQYLYVFGDSEETARLVVRILTMWLLGFIMIHVGYEFEIDKTNVKSYVVDYGVAATAAGFPWILVALYFMFVMLPADIWGNYDSWTDVLLASRFAAPTSAGVLFSMLAAAGLSGTWYFKKTRILAIFDDLDTILLMIPLKMLIVGIRWQLGVIILIMVVMLWLAWKYLHKIKIPVTWPWVLTYAAIITVVSEIIYKVSLLVDDVVPVHIEVLLPAFVLGCVMARPEGHDPHCDDCREGHQEGPESPEEQKVSTYVSGGFMVLVGLSMPSFASTLSGSESLNVSTLILHVLAVTVLANLGKMFSIFVYRREATLKERLAIGIGMWPRGEVGAGVLVISLGYGISGYIVTVAALSLALNLLLTGVFILIVKRLLRKGVGG